jgi:hypothetical protein
LLGARDPRSAELPAATSAELTALVQSFQLAM